jgi:hypothetical protein
MSIGVVRIWWDYFLEDYVVKEVLDASINLGRRRLYVFLQQVC